MTVEDRDVEVIGKRIEIPSTDVRKESAGHADRAQSPEDRELASDLRKLAAGGTPNRIPRCGQRTRVPPARSPPPRPTSSKKGADTTMASCIPVKRAIIGGIERPGFTRVRNSPTMCP